MDHHVDTFFESKLTESSISGNGDTLKEEHFDGY